MKYIQIKKNRAFVILFAVTLSAILLSIALGIANIAFREVKFGTNARDTNDAFFAADTGAECALYFSRSDQNSFPRPPATPGAPVDCASATPTVSGNIYSFKVTNIGSSGKDCAKVTVDKGSTPTSLTTIVSKGYNAWDCSSVASNLNRVEREVQVSY